MAYCSKCGSETNNCAYCPSCGTPTNNAIQQRSLANSSVYPQDVLLPKQENPIPQKKKSIANSILLVVLASIVLIGFVLWAFLFFRKGASPQSDSPEPPTSFSAASTQEDATTDESKPSTSVSTVPLEEDVPVTVTGISVYHAPKKLYYLPGEPLDTQGLMLEVQFSDGSTRTVTEGVSCSADLSSPGRREVRIEYDGCSTRYSVMVIAEHSDSTRKLQWHDFSAGSSYDGVRNLTGFLLNCMFTCNPNIEDGFYAENDFGGTLGHTPFYVDGAGYEYMYFSFWIPNDPALEGWHTITLYHDGTKEAAEIYLKYLGDYSHIVGTPCSAAGLGWEVLDWRSIPNIDDSNHDADNNDIKQGENKPTVPVEDPSIPAPEPVPEDTEPAATEPAATEPAEVPTTPSSEPEEVPVEVEKMSITRTYCAGTILNANSLHLTLHYNNGETELVTDNITCTPSILEEAGTHQVTVSYNGYSETFSVEVLDFYSLEASVDHNRGEGYNEDGRVGWVLYITARYNGNYVQSKFSHAIPISYGIEETWAERWNKASQGYSCRWGYSCSNMGFGKYHAGGAFILPDDPAFAGQYSATVSFAEVSKTVTFTLEYIGDYETGNGWTISNVNWT